MTRHSGRSTPSCWARKAENQELDKGAVLQFYRDYTMSLLLQEREKEYQDGQFVTGT